MRRKPGKIAARYKRDSDGDEDEDGDDAAMIAGTLLTGKPLVCMVLELPDEETVPEDVVETKKTEREGIISCLRVLNLDVEQLVNKQGDKLILTISCPRERLEDEAQAQGIRVRMNGEKYGGAMCRFHRKMNEEEAFAKSADECADLQALSSLQQQEITNSIVTSQPFDDGSGEAEAIDPGKLRQEGKILAYFYMHYDRSRLKLLANWAYAWSSPQPLDDVREYFGEKIALYYTWLGFYISMLWLPGLLGILLSLTKVLRDVVLSSSALGFQRYLKMACFDLGFVALKGIW